MPKDRVVVVGGQRFHYTEWGDGTAPVVLMLHGITGHARTWDEEAGALSDRYRVLALDARGHGDSDPAPDGDYSIASMATDLAGFAEGLALARMRIVALSMGGRVAIAYAGSHPDRVERLVVVDIGPDIAPAGRQRVGAMMAGAAERFATLEDALAYARAANPRYAEPLLRHRVEHGVRPLDGGGFAWKYDRALRDVVRSGRWHDGIDLWPAWASIRCPTLIIRGADSDVLAPETAKRMLATLPHARLVEVPDAGHTVPGDQPAAFLALVQNFLDG